MPLFESAHFVTGDFQKEGVLRRLPDREYGMALDCLVKACTDMLIHRRNAITGEDELLIAKRSIEPQPDWWFVPGGRMQCGDTPRMSCMKIFKRETGVNISNADRFEQVGHYTFVWGTRQQHPQENGTCDVSLVYTITLSDSEVTSMKLSGEEYSQSAWRTPASLIADLTLHAALRTAVADWEKRRAYNRLKEYFHSCNGETDSQQLPKHIAEEITAFFH